MLHLFTCAQPLKLNCLAYIWRMPISNLLHRGAIACLVVVGSGCASLSTETKLPSGTLSHSNVQSPGGLEKANDVVIYALGLVETGYRFGGKNPDAGLDCSGMVSYVFKQAAGVTLRGSAVDIARQGRAVERATVRPGDLVFFNTTGAAYSHVGIYIGDQRFVHAPNNGGKVRTDSLATGWFAPRLEATRTYFD